MSAGSPLAQSRVGSTNPGMSEEPGDPYPPRKRLAVATHMQLRSCVPLTRLPASTGLRPPFQTTREKSLSAGRSTTFLTDADTRWARTRCILGIGHLPCGEAGHVISSLARLKRFEREITVQQEVATETRPRGEDT